MPDAEVRVRSDSGASKGSKPARFDLIPTRPLWLLAEKYGKGTEKYPDVDGMDNWRHGYPFSLSYAALQRHLTAFWSGEDIDPESNTLHLTAAAWHCFTLMHYLMDEEIKTKYDDRQDVRRPTWVTERESAPIIAAEQRCSNCI